MAPPDADQYEKYRREIESLKAEVGTLNYKLQTSESEKHIALSQQSNKVEQATRREQEQIQLKQAAEAERAKATEQFETARRELDEFRDAHENEKRAFERRVREAEDGLRLAQEELENVSTATEEAARFQEKKLSDLQIHVAAVESTRQELQQEIGLRESRVQEIHDQLGAKDAKISELEADVLRLKAQSGDAETMQIIRKELTEQVQHMRALEATNRDQLSELKHLRSINKAVEVVEEEKRSLQRKLEVAESLEQELGEARLQRQRLEDERIAWTSYLKQQSGSDDQQFESPEDLARAWAEERLKSASQLEKIGALQAEVAAQQNAIQSFEEEKASLRSQVEEAKASASAGSADKARMRVERQRALAVKEVEYLRAQLKTFDVEDETMQPEQFDEARASRVQELEQIIDNYKSEVQSLHAELSSKEPSAGGLSPLPSAGSKRPRQVDEDSQEQLGQLTRKNRKLQEDLTGLQTQVALLEKDLSASREQLTAAKQQNSTRVLSLRSNPTSDYEAIKRSTLDALQKENKELLATLQSNNKDPSVSYVPTSVLGAMEREVAAARAETASAQKSARRLKEVWGSKSQEFKEAIFSTLGWTVTFIPNGKMRVESTFFPSQTDEHENSIVFDGERGTMKVGGGPKSAFARRISDQIGFWVREKGCIPGFLAALTLEFYEEHTKATKG